MKTYNIPTEIKTKYPYASWVGGRGWAGHKTLETARKSVKYAIKSPLYQGYPPQHVVVNCQTGQAA